MGAGATVANAYAVSQAVVKITREGRTTGGTGLRNQLQYISRSGEQDLQGQGGEVFDPEENGRYSALVREWQQDFDGMDKRATFATYHLVVSYPRGTDPRAAQLASTEFLEELTGGDYGDRWKYAIAHHRDTAFPHAHIVLNRAGLSGRTLQINRDSITVQDLRELHVETAKHYDIQLNATSRFSRNVDERPKSSGRLHAEREGRDLGEVSVEESPSNVFPFYGAAKRGSVNVERLRDAKRDLAAHYEKVAGQIAELPPAGFSERVDYIARRVKTAARLIREGQALTADQATAAHRASDHDKPAVETMQRPTAGDEQKRPTEASLKRSKGERESLVAKQAKRELEKLQRGVMAIYHKTRENIEQTPDEARKTEAELALSRIMKNHEEILSPDQRAELGRGIQRDEIQDVALGDRDPAKQRFVADREAKAVPAIRDKPDDDRNKKAQQRLDRADKDVINHIASSGINGDLAMQRIRDAPDVDRETRDKWADRDIQNLARTSKVSEKQARETYTRAFRDASQIYAKARDDIRKISRGPERAPDRSRADTQSQTRAQTNARKAKISRGRDDGISR